MTTNKPEVVAWRWRKPVVNDRGETVGVTAWELSDAPGFLPWWTSEPLIRLSDYEALQADRDQQYDMKVKAREQRNEVTTKLSALQAECEQLRKNLVLAGRWVPSPDPVCGCDACVEDAKLVAAIEAAMQGDSQ